MDRVLTGDGYTRASHQPESTSPAAKKGGSCFWKAGLAGSAAASSSPAPGPQQTPHWAAFRFLGGYLCFRPGGLGVLASSGTGLLFSLSLAGKQSFPCKGSGSQGLPCPPSSVCTSLIRNQEGKGQRLAESCNQDTQLWFRGHCSHGSFPGLAGSVWVWQRES